MDPLLQHIYDLDEAAMERAARHVMLGGGTRGGPVLVRGKGVRVWDTAGRDYIDCTSQSWALYLGYANDDINQVIREHIESLTHVHQGFDTKPRFYLAEKLASLAPGSLNRVSFTVGGGPAIEAAMKVCLKNVNPARDFVCLYDSYHGTTLGTMGASWISTHAAGSYVGGSRFLELTRPFIRIPNPYTYRNPYGVDAETYIDMCLTMARETFERGIAGRPAGVIVDPIQASGGQIILPARYLRGLRELCDEYQTLLVFDEIQTYARIGEWFAADYFGVEPDIIVLGKALGAGLPLAAIIISDRLQGFSPDTEELHTFANPSLSMVTAAKQIALLEAGVLDNCRQMGQYLGEGIRSLGLEFPEIGDIRQAGLHIGIEFVADPESKRPLENETVAIRDAGFNHGIIFGLGGVRKNVLKVKPPLIITRSEADEVLDKLQASMRDVLR
ncbi:MAG: aspartate aminotransferase family protein [Armatimonadetes bacterium]|nr:aspartate aminotransferase family protein [Armatimonadota bacterium]